MCLTLVLLESPPLAGPTALVLLHLAGDPLIPHEKLCCLSLTPAVRSGSAALYLQKPLLFSVSRWAILALSSKPPGGALPCQEAPVSFQLSTSNKISSLSHSLL